MVKVSEQMSTGVDPVLLDTGLVEAAQRMQVAGVGALPVLDREGARCVGVLTERDIVVRVLAEGRDPRAVIVRDIATLKPVTCEPDEESPALIARMREHEVQHLPVVEDERIAGVISLADIVFNRPDERRGIGLFPEEGSGADPDR